VFERFTDGARSAVVRAQQEALELRHGYLGTEHLLLGVAEAPGGAATVLGRLGFDVRAARADLVRIVGPGPSISATDADALRDLGIDVDEVRRRVEQAFGPGALDQGAAAVRGRSRRRRRRCDPEPSIGRVPFTPRAKRSLELAAREVRRLGRKRIGTEHILLGLMGRTDVLAVELLTAQGISIQALRRAILELDRGDDGGYSLVGA
jgi:ATP-dependent Clp protease ATP-binding subunit ClpA